MFIEASRRRPNDEAKLLTPHFRPGRYCIRFAYHMYGTGVGRLTVSSLEGSSVIRRLRWTTSGNQRNRWRDVSFQYNSVDNSKSIQFQFAASVGSTSSSDIALDDVRVIPGVCSTDLQNNLKLLKNQDQQLLHEEQLLQKPQPHLLMQSDLLP